MNCDKEGTLQVGVDASGASFLAFRVPNDIDTDAHHPHTHAVTGDLISSAQEQIVLPVMSGPIAANVHTLVRRPECSGSPIVMTPCVLMYAQEQSGFAHNVAVKASVTLAGGTASTEPLMAHESMNARAGE